jgi:hypothetical protein
VAQQTSSAQLASTNQPAGVTAYRRVFSL